MVESLPYKWASRDTKEQNDLLRISKCSFHNTKGTTLSARRRLVNEEVRKRKAPWQGCFKPLTVVDEHSSSLSKHPPAILDKCSSSASDFIYPWARFYILKPRHDYERCRSGGLQKYRPLGFLNMHRHHRVHEPWHFAAAEAGIRSCNFKASSWVT